MVSFRIIGAVQDSNTFFCEHLAKKVVASIGGNENEDVEMNLTFEVDFWVRVEEMKAQGHGQRLMHHREPHLVLRDKEIIGDMSEFIILAREVYGVEDAEVSNTVIFNRHVRECSYDMLRARNSVNPLVFLRFGLQDVKRPNDFEDLGIVYIELFAKDCPKAAENFKKLCEGVTSPGKYQYANCPIHRIVKNGWIQTGDVVDGSGKNSVAVLEDSETVPDESFAVDFGTPFGGIVGFANEGAHTNRSQFFITIAGCPWMNNKFVGIGRVLHGYSVLRMLNKIETSNQVPTRIVKITECGIPGEVLK